MGLSCEQNGKKLIGLIILWSKKNHLLLAFITMSTRAITPITTKAQPMSKQLPSAPMGLTGFGLPHQGQVLASLWQRPPQESQVESGICYPIALDITNILNIKHHK